MGRPVRRAGRFVARCDATRIRRELGASVPWHVTRFFPVQDLAHLPPTPLSTLKRAREIGREEGLDFVYIGNVPGAPEQDTLSPDCEEGAVRCSRLTAPEGRLRGGCCPGCGRAIPWNRPAANHPASRPA